MLTEPEIAGLVARIQSVPRGTLARRISRALSVAYQFGQADGAEHRLWTIDQIVRALTGEDYDIWIRRYESPDGDEVLGRWETGVAP